MKKNNIIQTKPKILRRANITIAVIASSFLLSVSLLVIKSVDTRGSSHQFFSEKSLPQKAENWEYRWDDIIPPDIDPAFPYAEGWTPVDNPLSVPERNGRGVLWLKSTLPQNSYPDPTLYCRLVFEIFDVYLDGKKIYTFGKTDQGNNIEFAGWPWHIIPISQGSGGKQIYFRIKSNHIKIGILGGVYVAPPGIHIIRMLQKQIDSFVLSFIFFFMGIFLITLFFRDSENQIRLGYFSLGGSSFLFGIFTLSKAGSDIKQLFLDSPLMWSYLEIASLYFIPVGFVSYIERFFSRFRILSILWKVHFATAIISLILIFTGLIPLSKTIIPNQVLMLITTCIIIITIFISVLKGSSEAKFFAFAILFLGITIFIDVLSAMGVLSIQRSISHWGIFLVFIALALLLGVRYRKLNLKIEESYHKLEQSNVELENYKDHLEKIVEERSRKLSESMEQLSKLNIELETLSRTDSLTGLMNRRYFNIRLDESFRHMMREARPISFLMIDIDFFKNYNDTFGHLAGDETLKRVAGILKDCACRSTDITSRFGGEEFAIVLPGTDMESSLIIAGEIRAGVISADIRTSDGLCFPQVTVSIGVASVIPQRNTDPEGLIAKADSALYRAKSGGRNIVYSYNEENDGQK